MKFNSWKSIWKLIYWYKIYKSIIGLDFILTYKIIAGWAIWFHLMHSKFDNVIVWDLEIVK